MVAGLRARWRRRCRVGDGELANWDGGFPEIVEIGGERWVLKDDGPREVLGARLGWGRVNVAAADLMPHGSRPRALVRLAENYRLRDLPIRNLDEAAAAELAFSLWTRRRDTHAFNRAYVDGIPMFFDHSAAFVPEDSVDHFARDGPDNGYVPRWRVEVWGEAATTLALRDRNRVTESAVHAISEPAVFAKHLERWVAELASIPTDWIRATVASCGFEVDDAERVAAMLTRSQGELPRAVELARTALAMPVAASA